jgi:hypothetical protein
MPAFGCRIEALSDEGPLRLSHIVITELLIRRARQAWRRGSFVHDPAYSQSATFLLGRSGGQEISRFLL